jgi:DNA-binding transcriptional LysR family regulator
LADGTLVEVLQPFAGRSRPVSLMYPHGRLLPSRVRVFVDFLMACRGPGKRAGAGKPARG